MEPSFAKLPVVAHKFQYAGSASSLEIKPQISVSFYCNILLHFLNMIVGFKVDLLPLVAAALQALQYLVKEYSSTWNIKCTYLA